MKPFTPQEAADAKAEFKINNIPDFVVRAVNSLITKKYHQSGFNLTQDEVIDEIEKCYAANTESCVPYERSMVFSKGWLDFEPLFNTFGWKVTYDKPAYYESYKAFYTFKKAS